MYLKAIDGINAVTANVRHHRELGESYGTRAVLWLILGAILSRWDTLWAWVGVAACCATAMHEYWECLRFYRHAKSLQAELERRMDAQEKGMTDG